MEIGLIERGTVRSSFNQSNYTFTTNVQMKQKGNNLNLYSSKGTINRRHHSVVITTALEDGILIIKYNKNNKQKKMNILI